MTSNLHDFMFDVDFGFGDDSVFTLIDKEITAPEPFIEGYFLYLAGPPFTLLDGETLDLL